jgi:predicted membrane-bound spermidine synthase
LAVGSWEFFYALPFCCRLLRIGVRSPALPGDLAAAARLFSGADLYSVTIIVASFMGGMGVGHLAGGHVADRVSPRTSLLCFAGAELAIALFGFFSRALYYDFLYNRVGAAEIPAPALALLLFISLLVPTFFMGASLPLLSRALASRLERAASVIGVLYGVNTLGAATGALVSTWVLLPRLGLDGSILVGVLFNVLCAVLVLPAVTGSRSSIAAASPADRGTQRLPSDGSSDVSFPFWIWACIFAASGLLALALEIVWFRVLAVTMKGTAFTFGTLLAVYLTGLGVGALIGSRVSARLRRPAVAFLAVQAAIGAVAMFLLTAFIRFADNVAPLWAYLGSYEPLDVRAAVNGTGDAATFSPCMWVCLRSSCCRRRCSWGFSFPVLQRVVQTSLPHVGRRVGVLLLANVIGSMAGTALTGFLLLDRVGTAGTMRLLAMVSAAFGALAIHMALRAPAHTHLRTPRAALLSLLGSALVFVPLLMVMPPSGTLWAHLHGTVVEAMVYAEDGSGLSVVNTDGRNAILYANGIGQGSMPYGEVHTALGALPAFIHPSPRTAAVIGLGSGDTVHAVAGRREIARVTCVEIIRGELTTLNGLRRRFPYGGLAQSGGGRPNRASVRRRPHSPSPRGPLRHHRSRCAAAGQRILRRALLGHLLHAGARASRAEWTGGDVGADAARLQHIHPRVPVRRRHAGDSHWQQRPDSDRSRGNRGASR